MTNTQTNDKTKPAAAAPNATRAAQASAAAPKAEKPKKEPKVDATLAKGIKVISETNPKREGSKAHTRFAMYSRDGKKPQTVEQYIELAVAAGQSRRAARADIAWDMEHGFIALLDLTPAK